LRLNDVLFIKTPSCTGFIPVVVGDVVFWQVNEGAENKSSLPFRV
jgi:hypothetical protein